MSAKSSADRKIEKLWLYARAIKNAVRKLDKVQANSPDYVAACIEFHRLFGKEFAERAKFIAEKRRWHRRFAEMDRFMARFDEKPAP